MFYSTTTELLDSDCSISFGGIIGRLISIEGRAIRRAYQGRGLGSLSLRKLIAEEEFDAVASVTRNPAVLKLMNKGFYTVLPDLNHTNPLHHMDDPLVNHLVNVYGEHIGADPTDLPFVPGRYKGGLYGYSDPGQGLKVLPKIADNPENGVIMIALDEVKVL